MFIPYAAKGAISLGELPDLMHSVRGLAEMLGGERKLKAFIDAVGVGHFSSRRGPPVQLPCKISGPNRPAWARRPVQVWCN